MLRFSDFTTDVKANFLSMIKSLPSSHPLAYCAFSKVLKEITQDTNITQMALLKAKPFTAYNIIHSISGTEALNKLTYSYFTLYMVNFLINHIIHLYIHS